MNGQSQTEATQHNRKKGARAHTVNFEIRTLKLVFNLAIKWGYLVDSSQWDKLYASFKAQELGMETPLTNRHWDIIFYLRRSYANNGVIPTVYETCEAFQIELEELQRLFPTGYHRGVVKISGLRVR